MQAGVTILIVTERVLGKTEDARHYEEQARLKRQAVHAKFYDPARDYRAPPPGYQERVLSPDDRVYRGQDGRYYCKRSDGTTGLIVGAAAGGLFGNVIAGGRSKTVGTLLGAIAGGALGSAVDRDQVRCR